MHTIFGWHPPWTWHDLGAPVASLVTLPVALAVFGFMVWLRRLAAAEHAFDDRPPLPGRVLCAVIGVISGAAIVAALLVIGRYWTGPALARWAWAWGVRWMLPVLLVVVVFVLDIRRGEPKHQPASVDPRGTGSGTTDVSGDGAGGAPVREAPPPR